MLQEDEEPRQLHRGGFTREGDRPGPQAPGPYVGSSTSKLRRRSQSVFWPLTDGLVAITMPSCFRCLRGGRPHDGGWGGRFIPSHTMFPSLLSACLCSQRCHRKLISSYCHAPPSRQGERLLRTYLLRRHAVDQSGPTTYDAHTMHSTTGSRQTTPDIGFRQIWGSFNHKNKKLCPMIDILRHLASSDERTSVTPTRLEPAVLMLRLAAATSWL